MKKSNKRRRETPNPGLGMQGGSSRSRRSRQRDDADAPPEPKRSRRKAQQEKAPQEDAAPVEQKAMEADKPGLGEAFTSQTETAAMKWAAGIVKNNAVLFLVLGTAFIWSYLPTLMRLVQTWNREPDYGHGYIVPVLAIAFLFIRRDLMPAIGNPAIIPGLALIAFSLVLRVAGALAFVDAVDAWSMLFWLAGAVWLFAGRHVMLWAIPSIAFLFFMIPLPFRAERMLSNQLQAISTNISCWTLQFFGQPAISDGNVIYLNDISYGVAEACSGMRIFMASLAFACAYMIMVRRTWWERLLILPFAIPLAMVANAMRIVATTLVTRYTNMDPHAAHDAMGLAMIPFAFLLFGAVVWYLGKLITDTDKMDVGSVVRLD